MPSGIEGTSASKGALWVGRTIGGLLVSFLLFDSVGKLLRLTPMIEGTERLGYPTALLLAIGAVELACTFLYVVPRTSVLGAILLTAFLGGATATHVRIADPFWFPIAFGVLLWGALFLRDLRLRALIPLRVR